LAVDILAKNRQLYVDENPHGDLSPWHIKS